MREQKERLLRYTRNDKRITVFANGVKRTHKKRTRGCFAALAMTVWKNKNEIASPDNYRDRNDREKVVCGITITVFT